MLLHRKLLSYLILKIMKTTTLKNRKNLKKSLFFTLVTATVLSLFSSCTTEELPHGKAVNNQELLARDVVADPPTGTPPPTHP